MRLDKFLADMGYGTRNEIKKMIRKGFVEIDGQVIKKADTNVDESTIVYFDGERIEYIAYEYYLLNKPAGYVTATKDNAHPVVMELIESVRKDLVPVGRLDKDTEGVLLITNDGDLNHALLSPKRHVDKTYYVETERPLPDMAKQIFSESIRFDDFTSKPADYEQISDTSAYLTIHEGKYHQVKRMFEYIGCPVTYLKRIRFGNLTLDGLETGEYRSLTEKEIDQLHLLVLQENE